MKKICKTCREEKELSEFHPHAGCKLGVRPECKKCRIERQKKYQEENHDEYLKYQRKHYSKNKGYYKKYANDYKETKNKLRRDKYKNDPEYREKQRKYVANYVKTHKNYKKRQRLKLKYGITLEKFNEILESQNNSCAICGMTTNDKKIFPFVDHCHETGIIRGILCSNCNFGIGKFKDDIELLERAIRYLKNSIKNPNKIIIPGCE